MPTSTEFPSQASWSRDQPDSPIPPVPELPYFDSSLDAWVFSRYADVTAALRNSTLVPCPLRSRRQTPSLDEEQHRRMRAETLDALPPARLRAWKQQLLQQSNDILRIIPLDRPVDLISEYARPICLAFAATVTHLQQEQASRLCEYARAVSIDAADPYNLALKQAARSADAELKPHFHTGPQTLRDSGFVGLSQTLPAMLGNIWFALLRNSQNWQLVREDTERIEQAIEELMRYSGFTRILSRLATEDVTLNGVSIRKGDHIILRLVAANHDSEAFENPHRLDLDRRGAAHLSFGAGLHSCVGAGLLRMASSAITLPLISGFRSARIARDIEWRGGAIFRFPQALWVCLDR